MQKAFDCVAQKASVFGAKNTKSQQNVLAYSCLATIAIMILHQLFVLG